MNWSDDSRRQISDLEVLHAQLEPQLRDIYVEGRADKRLFEWYFSEAEVPVSSVYAINDRVDIDSGLVHDVGAEVGPRGRLIALASAVSGWETGQLGVTCIIDADRSLLVPEREYPGILHRTDPSSIEGYLFKPSPLARLLSLVLGISADSEELIASTTPALHDLYVLRTVLHLEGPGVPVVSRWQRCCKIKDGAWRLDTDELIDRSLASEGLSDSRQTILAQFARYRQRAEGLAATPIRGHDIAPMLIHALGLRNDLGRPEVLELAWRGCLRIEDLHDEPLFRALRSRLT